MAFSYALFLSLMLLAPGFAAWAGVVAAERAELLSIRPERPNSTRTLFIVLIGALLGHAGASLILGMMSLPCEIGGPCLRLPFEPNLYKVIATPANDRGLQAAIAVPVWLFTIIATSYLTMLATEKASRDLDLDTRLQGRGQEWLAPLAAASREKNSAGIVGYVLSEVDLAGRHLAYEGTITKIGIDEDGAVTMIAMNTVERFHLEVSDEKVRRIDGLSPVIATMTLRGDKIANVAFQVARYAEEGEDLSEGDNTELPPNLAEIRQRGW